MRKRIDRHALCWSYNVFHRGHRGHADTNQIRDVRSVRGRSYCSSHTWGIFGFAVFEGRRASAVRPGVAMTRRTKKTPTQRRRRTRALRKRGIRELPTPARYNQLVEALEYWSQETGTKYLRSRNVTAEAARIIREWVQRQLTAKNAEACRGATDKP